MQGPSDESAPGTEEQPAAARSTSAASPARRRPRGGKALLRLVDLLETRGLTDTAETVVREAIPAESREEFRETARAFGVEISPAPAAEGEGPGRRRRRGRAGREDAEAEADETREALPDVSGGETTALAEEFLKVGDQLGPPGPGPQWRSIGPWTIPNGQTYGTSRVNVSGRVSAIAVHPSNPARVLCGAANGGVWESFDRGASWAPRTDYAATTTVGAIAYDRANPALVYCGTGEGNWWSFMGAGILRSTNGGTSWTQHCTAPFVGQGFYHLIVNPANSNHLLAATTGGLYVSTNGGTAWTQRRSSRTWGLAMAPAGGASAEILASCSDGIFRSTDGGTTWTAVGLPGSPGAFDRLAVDICNRNPAVAYAWGSGSGTPFLWRRAGGTWTAIATPPGVQTNQAWYDWFVAAAPDADTQVYCGAIEVHRGDLSGTTWTWRNLTNKSSTGQSIHPDQHAIAFEPGTNTIYIGNDGGLFRSPDRGITFQHCNNGLVISEFEYLAHHPGSSRWVLGGTQDNGTQRWAGSPAWEHVADGDGGDCGVNRTTPGTVFHTFFNMTPQRSTTNGDFGSWLNVFPPVPANEGSPFYPPFECSATGGDTIAMGGNALYVSRNNGTNWVRLAFPNGGTAGAMYIANADTVFVGLRDGRVLRTRWNGAAWPALALVGTPRANAVVSDLCVEPVNQTRIWAVSTTINGGRVFRSDNGGAAWVDCSAGLPALPVNAVEVDQANGNRVWVALDRGVYQTVNAGLSWSDFANGLPNAYVGDLLFHPQARVLRAATRNRGVWEIPVDGWMTQPVCGVQWTGTVAANQTQRWFTHSWPATWHVFWTVMPTSVRAGAPQITWTVQVERATPELVTYWITVQNLTAAPVTFEGRYCIFSRY
jgi:hypothetical protein